jgi:hypothetical protein
MFHYIILARFHAYNKIHLIHRNNLDKSWSRVHNERRKLRVLMNRKDYVKLLEKYNINNFS